MILTLKRRYKKADYTIGDLYVDGEWFCNIIEDTDRGLDSSMSFEDIARKKVYGKTAIPYGEYRIDMDTPSPKYTRLNPAYSRPYGHCMPRLIGVKGFSGILIHPGNTAKDSLGCLIPGLNTEKGKVTSSRSVWKKLMDIMLTDKDRLKIVIC